MLIDYFFFPMFEKNIAVFSGKHRHLSLKSIPLFTNYISGPVKEG
jgi:hypothetical protein